MLHQKHRHAGRIWLMEYLDWSKYSLDVVLLDDKTGVVLEVHEGRVHPPGSVKDNQTHQEQEAGLRDKENQPPATSSPEISMMGYDVKMIMLYLPKTFIKIIEPGVKDRVVADLVLDVHDEHRVGI